MTYKLKCLICGCTDVNLVKIQEHAMEMHGFTQDDHRSTNRIEIFPGHYQFKIAKSEKPWLDAQRLGGNVVDGL